MKRLLIVGRNAYAFPLQPSLRRRFDALSAELDWRQLGAGTSADDRFVLFAPFPVPALDGLVFHLLLPFRAARELRRFRPDAVLVQGAPEAALVLLARTLARVRTRVILDVHGDWRAPTRLYGSPLRRLLTPAADLLARFALARADAIRTVSPYTSGLVRAAGREPAAEFPAFMDLEPFLGPPAPLPEAPSALYVGSLERSKGIDVLARAWPLVRERVPAARLHVIGRGTLPAPSGKGVTHASGVATEEVAAALDAATLLVLPSRTEGMGRVAIEALSRGRAVVGSRVGGIPDLVTDGESGLLVPPGEPEALAEALVRVLGDPELAARLGAGAEVAAERLRPTPEAWAAGLRGLVAP